MKMWRMLVFFSICTLFSVQALQAEECSSLQQCVEFKPEFSSVFTVDIYEGVKLFLKCTHLEADKVNIWMYFENQTYLFVNQSKLADTCKTEYEFDTYSSYVTLIMLAPKKDLNGAVYSCVLHSSGKSFSVKVNSVKEHPKTTCYCNSSPQREEVPPGLIMSVVTPGEFVVKNITSTNKVRCDNINIHRPRTGNSTTNIAEIFCNSTSLAWNHGNITAVISGEKFIAGNHLEYVCGPISLQETATRTGRILGIVLPIVFLLVVVLAVLYKCKCM